MPKNKEAARVLAHPNGQRCELTQIHNHILLHAVRFGKVFCKTCAVMLALLGLAEAARIVYGPDDTRGKRKVCQQFTGWIGGDHGKRIPATALARQIC